MAQNVSVQTIPSICLWDSNQIKNIYNESINSSKVQMSLASSSDNNVCKIRNNAGKRLGK